MSFAHAIRTCLLGLEVFFDQLFSAVKATETVDSVLILFADFLLLAHRLLFLPCELGACQNNSRYTGRALQLTIRLDKDILVDVWRLC